MSFLLKNKHSVSISPSIVIFTVIFLFSLYFLVQIQGILVALFLSFIVMTALRPAVDKLNLRFKLPRALSIGIVYVLVISIIFGLFALIVPPLLTEAYSLLRSFDIPFFKQEIQNLSLTVQEVSALLNQFGDGAGMVFSLISATFSGLFAFFTMIVMSFYLMLDRPNLYKKVNWFSREAKYLKKAEKFIDSVEHQLGGWIRGQIILMVTIGVATFVGLSLLGVPFALPLAILAGFLEILPNLGPTLAAVPAVILAFVAGGPMMGGVVLVFYIVIQQFENNLLVPKIMQKSADVNPLMAILVILMGFKLGGVIGALLSIPIYIVLRSVYALLQDEDFKIF
jgi:predicted PurR-regulated permease PerM